jgi:hypothetical protein
MRLHFKKMVDVKEDIFDPLPHNKIGAVSLRERPNVEVLVDMYDSATPAQIQNVIDRAKNKGLVLVEQEQGTFVVEDPPQ